MVGHDHERVEPPARALAGLEKAGLERGPGGGVRENPFSIIATVDDVVNRSRKLQPKFARHSPDGCRGALISPASSYPKNRDARLAVSLGSTEKLKA